MPSAERPVIADSTPIISLALLGRLDLLRHLYREVLIPPAVFAELVAGGSRPAGLEDLKAVPWIRRVSLAEPGRFAFFADLDRGEAEVLALALERDAWVVVVDKRLGRRHAARLGLRLTGTLGLLMAGKREGLVDRVEPMLDRLQESGFRMSPELREKTLALVGES